MSALPDTTQEDPTARQLRLLQEMSEVGMELARLAAETASIDPGSPESEDAMRKFTVISRMVLQTITLENRIAAGAKSAAQPAQPAQPSQIVQPSHVPQPPQAVLPDPRRAPLRRGLIIATENQPDRTALRRRADALINQELAQDPEQANSIYALLVSICHDLKITLDLARMPDECIGYSDEPPADKNDPAQPEIDVLSDEFFS